MYYIYNFRKRKNLNTGILYGRTMLFQKEVGYQMKISVPAVGYLVTGQEGQRGSPKNTVYCRHSWLPTMSRAQDATAKDITHAGCRAQRNQAGADLRTSSLLASFHS